MKLNKKWGLVLLAVWLIASGALNLFAPALLGQSIVKILFDVVVLAAGVLILIDR